MEYIFNRLFASVLTVTPWVLILIGLLMVFRHRFRHRISPRFFQLAFLLLALRLALPFDFSMDTAPIQAPMPTVVQQQLEQEPLPIPQMTRVPIAEITTETPVEAVQPPVNWLMLIWLFGVVVFLAFRLIPYGVFQAKIFKNRRLAEPEVQEMAGAFFKWPTRIYVMPDLPSPMLVGLFRPAVYLPKENLRLTELPYILAHEACHARRLDVPAQFLLLAAQAVHWFNPMVHWMARAARQDMERGCDEAVLNGQSLDYRKAYGETVLAGLARARKQRMMVLSTGFSTNYDMKARFQEMFDFTNKKRGLPILAGLVGVVVLASVAIGTGTSVQAEEASNAPALVVSTEADAQQQQDVQQNASEESLLKEAEKEPQIKLVPETSNKETGTQESGLGWPVEQGKATGVSHWQEEKHKGIDITAEDGTPVLAAHSGTVQEAGYKHEEGNYVVLRGEGFITRYHHCKSLNVQTGDTVTAGDTVAFVGNTGTSTGNHLHFEVYKENENEAELLNPKEYLKIPAGM